MKRRLLLAAILPLTLLLTACDVESMGSLQDFAKPYAGIYECSAMTLGGEDISASFEYVRLELGYGGEYSLTYRTAAGEEGGIAGAYAFDTERGRLTLFGGSARALSHTLYVTDGAVFLDCALHGRALHAEFRMP